MDFKKGDKCRLTEPFEVHLQADNVLVICAGTEAQIMELRVGFAPMQLYCKMLISHACHIQTWIPITKVRPLENQPTCKRSCHSQISRNHSES